MQRVNSIENYDHCVPLVFRRNQRKSAYVNRKLEVGKKENVLKQSKCFSFSCTVVIRLAKGNISVNDTHMVKYFASASQFSSFHTQRNFEGTRHRCLRSINGNKVTLYSPFRLEVLQETHLTSSFVD